MLHSVNSGFRNSFECSIRLTEDRAASDHSTPLFLVEIYLKVSSLNFVELQRRLIAYLREKVRNGDITERRLARITGVSQPHIHHVLSGKRGLSMDMADQILRSLRIDLLDFVGPEDRAEWKSRE